MKKNIVLMLVIQAFILGSAFANSKAKKFHVYGALNMGREFTETAENSNDTAYYNTFHFERPGIGFGADYLLDLELLSPRIKWRSGFYYEMKRTTQQVSAHTAGLSSRDDSIDLQAKILSFTGLYDLKHYDLLFGVNYTLMDSDDDREFDDFEVKDDYGFHAGFGYERNQYRYQIIYRYLTHDTKADDGYKGKIDLSSVLLTVGSYF